MGGQRRTAARAIGHHLEALIQKALIPDLLQCPPFGLDIIILIGDIGVIHVRPETDGPGEILPHPLILPDGFLTLLDKGLDPVLLDLFAFRGT